jgi:hypothetical protein
MQEQHKIHHSAVVLNLLISRILHEAVALVVVTLCSLETVVLEAAQMVMVASQAVVIIILDQINKDILVAPSQAEEVVVVEPDKLAIALVVLEQ